MGGTPDCRSLPFALVAVSPSSRAHSFFVEHFIKDLGIALDESRRMGLSLPGLALAHQLYVAVQAQVCVARIDAL